MEENKTTLSIDDMDLFYSKIEEEKRKKEEKKKVSTFIKYDAKHYLATKLETKELKNGKSIICRIIDAFDPDDGEAGRFPFKKVHVHMVKMKTGGVKLYTCLKHTEGIEHLNFGENCPFCEMHEVLLNQTKSIEDTVLRKEKYKEAMSFAPNEQWICRVIDRDLEEDGPKFWRFPSSNNQKGVYDMIHGLYQERKNQCNIYDRHNGKDIKINIVGKEDAKGKKKSSISYIIDSGDIKPLCNDEEQMDLWINDSKKWYQVFPPKPYGYLEVCVFGHTPMLHPENKDVWTSKNEFDSIVSKGGVPVYDFEEKEWIDISDEINKEKEKYQNEIDEMNFSGELPNDNLMDEILTDEENDLPF